MSRILDITLILLTLAIIVVRSGSWLGSGTPPEPVLAADGMDVSMEQVRLVFPDAARLHSVDTSWAEVYNSRQQKVGEIILSSPYADRVIGFAGRTPLLIALDTTETITQVLLLDNVESPSFVRSVENAGLFNSWNGLSLADALHKNVDNVSGATYTSRAVVNSLQVRLAAALNAEQQRAAFPWGAVIRHLCIFIVLGLALYSFFRPAKAKKFRIVLLLLSVAILGLWQSSMLSLAQLFTWLTNGIPLATQWAMLLVLIFAVALPMLTGKAFYCSYLCPFGAAQELVGKLNKRKISLRKKLVSWLMFLRKAILIFIVMLLILGLEFDLTMIEPFSAFNTSAAAVATIVIAVVSLVLSVFITKPWCRFFCPTGQTLDALKRRAVKKKRSK